MQRSDRFPILAAAALAVAGAAASIPTSALKSVEADDRPASRLVTGRWIEPIGEHHGVGSFPANTALSPDGKYLAITTTGSRQALTVVRVTDGQVTDRREISGPAKGREAGLYFGLAFGPAAAAGTPLYVSRGAEDTISVYTLGATGLLKEQGAPLEDPSPVAAVPHNVAGLAVDPSGTTLVAVHNATNRQRGLKGSLSLLDLSRRARTRRVELPAFPLDVVIAPSPTGSELAFVSCEEAGVVAVVELSSGTVLRSIPVGSQTSYLSATPDRRKVWVAVSGADEVARIDVASLEVDRRISVRPDEAGRLPGCTPLGMDSSADGKTLYVALADLNAVAVINVHSGRTTGLIPAGWYPTSVRVTPAGAHLLVTSAKGIRPRNPNGVGADLRGDVGTARGVASSRDRYILNVLEGVVSRVELPSRETARHWTRLSLRLAGLDQPARMSADTGNPGIEHVIYILKENRTYDQVLGDLPRGNGEPNLCLFPRPVTPNHHALAERFALLDNFYVNAEVSADGWNWSTAGMISEYNARNAPYGYSRRGRDYDYEGRVGGTPVDLEGLPDVNRPASGYIWEHAIRQNVSLRNYGFFTSSGPATGKDPDGKPLGSDNVPSKKQLVGVTDTDFRQFDMAYADSDAWVTYNCPAPQQLGSFGKNGSRSRFEEWAREYREFIRTGAMPRLTLVRLPRDHTQGTAVGHSSPRAMVADNDYALGQIVELVSNSPYWMKTAIVVLEDDAQNGYDHVDAHRSFCLVISPYTRRGVLDSRFYNTTSALRTMLSLLGMAPMGQYDAIAPRIDVLQPTPENREPYRAILPARDIIAEVNSRMAYRAADSSRFDFSREDAVPDDELTDIVWHSVKGRSTTPWAWSRRPKADSD